MVSGTYRGNLLYMVCVLAESTIPHQAERRYHELKMNPLRQNSDNFEDVIFVIAYTNIASSEESGFSDSLKIWGRCQRNGKKIAFLHCRMTPPWMPCLGFFSLRHQNCRNFVDAALFSNLHGTTSSFGVVLCAYIIKMSPVSSCRHAVILICLYASVEIRTRGPMTPLWMPCDGFYYISYRP